MLGAQCLDSSDDQQLEFDFFSNGEGKITDTGIQNCLIGPLIDKDSQLSTYKVKIAQNKALTLFRDPLAGTGGLLWPAGEVLADYLCSSARSNPDFLLDKRILELGSGTGVVGLSVAMSTILGNGCVYLTDLEKVLPILKKNVMLNGNIDHVHVRLLEWGSTIPDDLKDCDIILLADCVYLESLFAPLISTLLQVMQKPGAKGYLCYKKRRKADGSFFKLLRKHFWVESLDLCAISAESKGIDLYLLAMKAKVTS